jgi:hypothetical protein
VIEIGDDRREAAGVGAPIAHELRQCISGVEGDVQSSPSSFGDIVPVGVQPFCDAVARGPGPDDGDRIASSERGAEQCAQLAQAVTVVGAKLDRMFAAGLVGDRQERRQGGHEQPPGERMIDGADEIRMNPRLHDVAVATRSDGRGDIFVPVMHREKDDPPTRPRSFQFAGCFKAVELRHRDVKDDHVWIQTTRGI